MDDRILGGLAASAAVVIIGTVWISLTAALVLAAVVMVAAIAGKWLGVKAGPR
jgi:hypothetical protein